LREEEVCNALKNLAELKDEGYLTQGQYITEVKAVLEQAEKSGLNRDIVISECAVEDASTPPGDMLDLRELEGGLEDRLVHPPEDIVSEILDRHDAVRTRPIILDEPPADTVIPDAQQSMAPEGRVIVAGKAPWDDNDQKRFKLDTTGEGGKTDINQDRKAIYENIILRERLATMATKTNRKLDIHKNEYLAAGLSMILPGLGHLYLGMLATGVGLVLVAGVLLILNFMSEESIFVILLPVWMLAALMAYKHAQDFNYRLDRKRAVRKRSGRGLSVSSIEKTTRTRHS